MDREIEFEAILDAVARGRWDDVRRAEMMAPSWTREATSALCLKASRFDGFRALGIEATPMSYVHAAACGNLGAIRWLLTERVAVPANLSTYAAARGHGDAADKLMSIGIGGSLALAAGAAEAAGDPGLAERLAGAEKLGNERMAGRLARWRRSRAAPPGGGERAGGGAEASRVREMIVDVVRKDDLSTFSCIHALSATRCLDPEVLLEVDRARAERIRRFLDLLY